MLSFDSPQITPWHPWPVAFKFIALCATSLLLFIFDSVGVQVIALIVCAVLYLVCGRSFLWLGIKRLFFLWPFFLVVGAWHIYSNTPQQGVMILLRLLAVIGLSNLVTMTSRLSDVLDMISRALSPLRALGVNTRPVELAVALLVRFTPEFVKNASALKDAWRSRSNKRPGWRLVFPMSLSAIDDAEQVAEALRARGGTAPVKGILRS